MSNHSQPAQSNRFDVLKLILEIIKAVVVIGGVLIALQQLNAILDERRHAQFETTSAMLMKFGEIDVIDGVTAFMDAETMERTPSNYNLVLQRLTPSKQVFIVWSACLADGICNEGASRELMCKRLLAYELAFREMAKNFSKPYDEDQRRASYFGEYEKCETDHPILINGVNAQ